MQRAVVVRAVLSFALGAGLAVVPGAGATDFSSRDLLIADFSLDEQGPLADAQADLAAADAALAAAQAELDALLAAPIPDPVAIQAAEDEVAARQADYDVALAAVEAIEAEIALTAELVNQLSAEQVHDLNAALQNARKTGLLPLELDAAHLQAVLDGSYGTREIHALIDAYEARARFERVALRFVERYAATGNPHFQAQADRFAAKGLAQEEKFLAKLDRFAAQEARQEAREAAHEAAAAERTNNGNHYAKGKNR
jgi:hypothetical protein